MTRCIFLGPSLPLAQARDICDGVYLPPVRQGDIIRAVSDHQPRVLAIIDGFFEQVPAVWHKEILWALQQGIQVLGASSMGALRAAELHQFGMIGVGKIFQAYAKGRFAPFDEAFEDDDEVAVLHGPAETNYAGTVALVDMRATLAKAEQAGVIGRDARDRLAGLAKSLFYKDRTYKALIEGTRRAEAGLEPAIMDQVAALESWLPDGSISQKSIDAVELLQKIAQSRGHNEVPDFRLEPSSVWVQALKEVQKEFGRKGDERETAPRAAPETDRS